MRSSNAGEEMCMESGSAASRRGGKKAAEHKANKQPQRGLGVAQLEKIRLHNQMMAAYRSHQDVRIMQVPFAAPSVAPVAGAPSFQPYLTDCNVEATDRGIIGVQYYDNLLPYSSSPPPPLFPHDVRDSPGQRLGQGRKPQQRYCVSTSDASSAEELDLELRL
ncbi:protein SPEAR1-like [Phragmites australis]|uniref:protein SPEAR1-like n=1 Tax=Phragmites australis TaxID=29695 RepID=UPI002D77525E|nr:protein SPEAR1-like [Phragmites australis]